MNIVEENWEQILNKMKLEYCSSNISYNTWIAPLTVYEVTDDTVYILVKLRASLEHIEEKYLLPFKVCIAEVTGYEYEVSFVTDDHVVIQEKKDTAVKKQQSNAIFEQANLNPKYTFDGKTHLMHSIAHFILEKDPTKKVLYVTSETFTNELIDALKIGKNGNELAMTTFREKYRNNDVLLIDDIQFIIGKESTQEEFFHTFNHLHVSGKQIIISSDKPPKDIETLEARLRTRFEWGLIADISSPDYETRMAILRKKEELDGLERYHIPDEVMQYIANNITSNIRELEGSLNKLIALANLENKPIDIPLAAEALKDMISPNNTREITPELIIEVVSDHFNVPAAELKGKKRNAEIVLPRQIVMYLCRKMTDTPLKTIGLILGGKDHASVSHGVKKIEHDVKTDEALNNTVNIIKKKLNPI